MTQVTTTTNTAHYDIIVLLEDGSVDLEAFRRNCPNVYPLVYRQGAQQPLFVDLRDGASKNTNIEAIGFNDYSTSLPDDYATDDTTD